MKIIILINTLKTYCIDKIKINKKTNYFNLIKEKREKAQIQKMKNGKMEVNLQDEKKLKNKKKLFLHCYVNVVENLDKMGSFPGKK